MCTRGVLAVCPAVIHVQIPGSRCFPNFVYVSYILIAYILYKYYIIYNKNILSVLLFVCRWFVLKSVFSVFQYVCVLLYPFVTQTGVLRGILSSWPVSHAPANTRAMRLQPYEWLRAQLNAMALTRVTDQQVYYTPYADGSVMHEQDNKIITNSMSYSEARCCFCCSKKCHITLCCLALGSIKQRKWLTIALLTV